jgi:adenylate cyclase
MYLYTLVGQFSGNMLRNAYNLYRADELYQQSLQIRKNSESLLQISRALASNTDMTTIVSIIVNKVPELVACERCTLFFIDKEKRELVVSRGASSGRAGGNAPELPFGDKTEMRFAIDKGLAGVVATTGQIINIPNAQEDPRFDNS